MRAANLRATVGESKIKISAEVRAFLLKYAKPVRYNIDALRDKAKQLIIEGSALDEIHEETEALLVWLARGIVPILSLTLI